MSAAEDRMGRAAERAYDRPFADREQVEPRGILSQEERLLIEPPRDQKWREQEEAWLYFALDLARSSRAALRDAREADYAYFQATRELAVTCARVHVDALRRAGYTLDHILADRVIAEGVDHSPPISYRQPLHGCPGCGEKCSGGIRCAKCETQYQREQRGHTQW